MLGLLALQGDPGADEPLAFTSVHVVFAEEQSHGLISSFGHIFVCLPERDIDEVSDLLNSPALNFGADTSPLGKGIWVGEYKLQPGHELFRKNTRFDQRRLTVFELDIPDDRIRQLREDLGVRLDREYPYNFLLKNCGYFILDWLKGPQDQGAALLYLTPREALAEILSAFPPKVVRTIHSDLEVLQGRLLEPDSVDRHVLRAALSDATKLSEIEDLETRLLAIKVAESTAQRDEFLALQHLRADTLANPGGQEAARSIIARYSSLEEGFAPHWSIEAEGPAMAISMPYYLDDGVYGLRISGELGLRDKFTQPQPSHVLREATLLRLTLEEKSDSVLADVILASFSTSRDAQGLLGGASNGASLGYATLPNPLGTSGLYFSTWGGLSMHTSSGWLGARINLAAEELHDQPKANIAAGLTWDLLLPKSVTHCEALLGLQGELGFELRHDLILSSHTSLRIDWIHPPDNQDVLSIGIQLRY